MRIYKHLGWRGYARIVRGIADNPATAAELSRQHGIFINTSRTILRSLHQLGAIRVSEWVRQSRAPMVPRYAYGPGDDVPRPPNRSNGLPSLHRAAAVQRIRVGIELVTFAAMLRALADDALTAKLLAEEVGIFRNDASAWLTYSRGIGLVYVAGWERRAVGGGQPTAIYRLGIDRKDAPRPTPRPRAEIAQRSALRRAERLGFKTLASSFSVAHHPHHEEAFA